MPKSRADYMRRYRANKKQAQESKAVVKSILDSMIDNAMVVGEARYKCRIISEIIESKSQDDPVIIETKDAPAIVKARAIVTKMEERKRKQAEHMRKWRADKRAEDEEAYLNIQREYRKRKKKEEKEALELLSHYNIED